MSTVKSTIIAKGTGKISIADPVGTGLAGVVWDDALLSLKNSFVISQEAPTVSESFCDQYDAPISSTKKAGKMTITFSLPNTARKWWEMLCNTVSTTQAGAAQVSTLSLTAGTAAGNISIKLSDVVYNFAVTSAMTPTAMAALIAAGTFAGWTATAAVGVVTFTATAAGVKTTPLFNGGSTTVAGVVANTTVGTNAGVYVPAAGFEAIGVKLNVKSVKKMIKCNILGDGQTYIFPNLDWTSFISKKNDDDPMAFDITATVMAVLDDTTPDYIVVNALDA